MLDKNSAEIGRFDRSFLVHMIKDFFVILLLVTLVEFAFKAALVWWNWQNAGTAEAQVVADDLAENVRSIMRNEGGPVAARTMYPILERNWTDLGYEIAIEPSDVTIRSIEAGFGFVPLGVPAGPWPDGAFKQAHVEITAEAFCLGCHSEAEVGEVLGSVTVRNYLARDFALWTEDVRLTAALSVGKILLHSVLLFLILKARLEPLMGLRSTVSNLARAYGGLHHRAEIRTADEFGTLARDLNLFLDRLTRIVGELDDVLRRVATVNDDIIAVQTRLRAGVDGVVGGMRAVERQAMLAAKVEPRLSQEWFDAMDLAIGRLEHAAEETRASENAAGETRASETRASETRASETRAGETRAGETRAGETWAAGTGAAGTRAAATGAAATGAGETGVPALLDALRSVIVNARAQMATSEALFARLADLGDESAALKDEVAEMGRLEERMKTIVQTCSDLVQRLGAEAAHGSKTA